jgi:hypothetical protein
VTLILTAMTRRSVVQVADMRLTNVRTGRVTDEATAKMVVYAGRLVLSFAGTACMGSEPTAQWMTNVLAGIEDPDEILTTLARSAERIVSRYPADIRRLAVVGAGWLGHPDRPRPIYLEVTNFDFQSGALLDRFQTSATELGPNEKVLLMCAGVDIPGSLVDDVQKLMSLRADRREERPAEFVTMLLRLARVVAATNRTVGRDMLVASLPSVHPTRAPRLSRTGISVPTGVPDWREPTYLHVRGNARRMTTPAFAAPGVATSGSTVQLGDPPPTMPLNPCA